MIRLVENTIEALEIDFGAAKGDIIIDKGVPKIIEMAPRTSGGWFGAGSIVFATGVNPLRPLIQMSARLDPDLDCLIPKFELGCAQRYVIPPQSGMLDSGKGIAEAGNSPGVRLAKFAFPPLGTAIRKATNHADRFGHVICTDVDRESAIIFADKAISKISIEIQ